LDGPPKISPFGFTPGYPGGAYIAFTTSLGCHNSLYNPVVSLDGQRYGMHCTDSQR